MLKHLFSGSAAIATALALLIGAGAAHASSGVSAPDRSWSFTGPFGQFDRPSIRRGLQVYQEICASCHSLDLVAYRNLLEIGVSIDDAKAIAAEYEVEDGPDEEGEMFMRPARLSDRFVPPFANKNAARAANAGSHPPDLSLMTKARKNGPNYLHALLTGYKEEAPDGIEMADGMSYNVYFPGNLIAMGPPLSDDAVEYADGTKATTDQLAHDVVNFLVWAAQPELEARHKMGIKVLLFLIVLTAMMYALKRKIWSDLH